MENSSDSLDSRLTLAGLLFEITTSLRIETERSLDATIGLTGSGFEVLLRLARTEGNQLRLSDLALQTQMTRSGLTRAVDGLEELGFVERKKCPSDKRGTFALLTEAGRAAFESTVPNHLDLLDDKLLAPIDVEERKELEQILRKIRDHIHETATSGAHDSTP